jgi:hypothetical protein
MHAHRIRRPSKTAGQGCSARGICALGAARGRQGAAFAQTAARRVCMESALAAKGAWRTLNSPTVTCLAHTVLWGVWRHCKALPLQGKSIYPT